MELIQSTPAEQQLALIFRALGHPLRLSIVRYIAAHPRCICNDIVVRTERAQSTISQHLRVLVQANIVKTDADGQTSVFWLAPHTLELVGQALIVLTKKERLWPFPEVSP